MLRVVVTYVGFFGAAFLMGFVRSASDRPKQAKATRVVFVNIIVLCVCAGDRGGGGRTRMSTERFTITQEESRLDETKGARPGEAQAQAQHTPATNDNELLLQ